jgi:hypothetical protein
VTHRQALESVVDQVDDACHLRETWELVARLHNIARTAAAALTLPDQSFRAGVAGGVLTVTRTSDGRMKVEWAGKEKGPPAGVEAAHWKLIRDWPWPNGPVPHLGAFREAVRDAIGAAKPDSDGWYYGTVTITPFDEYDAMKEVIAVVALAQKAVDEGLCRLGRGSVLVTDPAGGPPTCCLLGAAGLAAGMTHDQLDYSGVNLLEEESMLERLSLDAPIARAIAAGFDGVLPEMYAGSPSYEAGQAFHKKNCPAMRKD